MNLLVSVMASVKMYYTLHIPAQTEKRKFPKKYRKMLLYLDVEVTIRFTLKTIVYIGNYCYFI